MGHLCDECEICVQLKKGIVPKALDFGYAPCAAALEECRRIQNSLPIISQADLLLSDLREGDFVPDKNVYYVDTESEEEPAKKEFKVSPKVPQKGFVGKLKNFLRA